MLDRKHTFPVHCAYLCKDCCHDNADNEQCADPAHELLAKHLPVDTLGEALHETHTDDTTSDALAGTGGQTQSGQIEHTAQQ